jgi:hypothetical protein
VIARHAPEGVCSRAGPAAAIGVYSRDFLDHVDARDYQGHAPTPDPLRERACSEVGVRALHAAFDECAQAARAAAARSDHRPRR